MVARIGNLALEAQSVICEIICSGYGFERVSGGVARIGNLALEAQRDKYQ